MAFGSGLFNSLVSTLTRNFMAKFASPGKLKAVLGTGAAATAVAATTSVPTPGKMGLDVSPLVSNAVWAASRDPITPLSILKEVRDNAGDPGAQLEAIGVQGMSYYWDIIQDFLDSSKSWIVKTSGELPAPGAPQVDVVPTGEGRHTTVFHADYIDPGATPIIIEGDMTEQQIIAVLTPEDRKRYIRMRKSEMMKRAADTSVTQHLGGKNDGILRTGR